MAQDPGLASTLEWLRRLVAQPTVAGHSNQQLVSDVATSLEDLGATVRVTPATRADALNLHAVLGPRDAEGAVMLAAHTDVVDVEGQAWSRDPFQATVEGDRVYGRGTTDMKGFLAVALSALQQLDTRRLRRPLWLALSSDEELGCIGVRPLLHDLVALDHRPAWGLVGEPTSLRVVDRHKGKAAVRVEFHGRAAHSSLPHEGANAVAYAGRLIAAILDRQRQIAGGERDPSFEVPYTTLGVGPIRGGLAVNIVPDHCRLDVEVRTIPGDEPGAYVQQIAELCAALEEELRLEYPGGKVTLTELSGYPGLGPAGVPSVENEITLVCGTGRRGAVDFGTEAGLYSRHLGIPVVVCGPGSMADAHAPDESVALAELGGCGRMIGNLLATLGAGTHPAPAEKHRGGISTAGSARPMQRRASPN